MSAAASNSLNMVAVRVGKKESSSTLSWVCHTAGVPSPLHWPANSPAVPQRADWSMIAVLTVLANAWYMAAEVVGDSTVVKSLLM